MPRQKLKLNVDGKMKCKVRKRGTTTTTTTTGSSSPSCSSNYRLKQHRAILVGKRVGSSTPVPRWKMMMSSCSKSPPLDQENDDKPLLLLLFNMNELSSVVSARKLGATLWEMQDGLPWNDFEDEITLNSELGGVVRNERILEDSMALVLSHLLPSPVSQTMDPPKVVSHRRRASVGSQKLLQADCNLGGDKSPHNCFPEVDKKQAHAQSPFRHTIGAKSRLKDVYNGLITSKEVLKIMSRICRFEQDNSTSLSLFSALKFELDRACIHVAKLIQEHRTSRSEMDILLNKLEQDKVVWKLKEQDRIRNAITCIAGELETERKLRRQTERLSKKLGRELAETKESLSRANKEVESEKRAREILEQVCDELARGIGEDRAEVEELKRQSEKVREEVEKEREMLQLADVLREERVQMKLSEAKYQFEEKNALVDKLRNELESYLRSKRRGKKDEQEEEEEEENVSSPSYDKIKELEKYLRETLPGSYHQYQDKDKDDHEAVNKVEEEEEEEDDDDDDSADDSDLHSIELNMDLINQSFQWSDAIKNGAKRNSFDKSTKGRKSVRKPINISSEANFEEWEFSANNNNNNNNNNKQESLDEFDKRGVFEFASKPWKKDREDEIERYNMIKDLRDHIVSGSRMGSSQDLANHSQDQHTTVSSKDPSSGVVYQG